MPALHSLADPLPAPPPALPPKTTIPSPSDGPWGGRSGFDLRTVDQYGDPVLFEVRDEDLWLSCGGNGPVQVARGSAEKPAVRLVQEGLVALAVFCQLGGGTEAVVRIPYSVSADIPPALESLCGLAQTCFAQDRATQNRTVPVMEVGPRGRRASSMSQASIPPSRLSTASPKNLDFRASGFASQLDAELLNTVQLSPRHNPLTTSTTMSSPTKRRGLGQLRGVNGSSARFRGRLKVQPLPSPAMTVTGAAGSTSSAFCFGEREISFVPSGLPSTTATRQRRATLLSGSGRRASSERRISGAAGRAAMEAKLQEAEERALSLSQRVGDIARKHHSASPLRGFFFLVEAVLFLMFVALFSTLALHDRRGTESYVAQEALRSYFIDSRFKSIGTMEQAFDWLDQHFTKRVGAAARLWDEVTPRTPIEAPDLFRTLNNQSWATTSTCVDDPLGFVRDRVGVTCSFIVGLGCDTDVGMLDPRLQGVLISDLCPYSCGDPTLGRGCWACPGQSEGACAEACPGASRSVNTTSNGTSNATAGAAEGCWKCGADGKPMQVCSAGLGPRRWSRHCTTAVLRYLGDNVSTLHALIRQLPGLPSEVRNGGSAHVGDPNWPYLADCGAERVALQMYLIGDVKIRQLRTRRNDGCSVVNWVPSPLRFCSPAWTPSANDKSPMIDANNRTWTYIEPTDPKICVAPLERHCNAPILSSYTLTFYPSGGFVWPLEFAKGDTFGLVRRADWVTEDTRIVIVEATFYNPSENLFIPMRLVFETPPAGGIFPKVMLSPSRLYRNPDNAQDRRDEHIDWFCMVYCATQLAVCAWMLAWTAVAAARKPPCLVCDEAALHSEFAMPWYECSKCGHCFDRRFHQSCPREPPGDPAAPPCGQPVEHWTHNCWRKFLYNGWIFLDIVNYVVFIWCWHERVVITDSITTFVDWMNARFGKGSTVGFVLEEGEMWPDVNALAFYMDLTLRFNALNLLACYFKLAFKYLGRFELFALFARTFQRGMSANAAFMGFLAVLLIGFGLAFHINFATANMMYSSTLGTFMQVIVGLVGDIEYQDVRPSLLDSGDRFVGPLIYLSFVVLTVLIMINVLIGIIATSYNEVLDAGSRDDHTRSSVLRFGMDVRARWWEGCWLQKQVEAVQARAREMRFQASVFTVEDIKAAWIMVDRNNDGVLDLEEQQLLADLVGSAAKIRALDTDNDGRITQEELLQVVDHPDNKARAAGPLGLAAAQIDARAGSMVSAASYPRATCANIETEPPPKEYSDVAEARSSPGSAASSRSGSPRGQSATSLIDDLFTVQGLVSRKILSSVDADAAKARILKALKTQRPGGADIDRLALLQAVGFLDEGEVSGVADASSQRNSG